MKKVINLPWLMLLVCLSACSKHTTTPTSNISGAVNYATPITLPDNTIVELRLTDVSMNDGALEVAKATAKLTALPYRYSLPYDSSKIDPRHRYTVDVRILSAGVLKFSTDTAYAVLTEGQSAQRDINVIAIGAPEASPIGAAVATHAPATNSATFRGELRTGQQISLYTAGLQDGHILWLEEDRSTDTPQPLHARYDFNGAFITHYTDSSLVEIKFDERGRVLELLQNRHGIKAGEHMEIVNTVRNRAELLRSHALAASEIKMHRQATGG